MSNEAASDAAKTVTTVVAEASPAASPAASAAARESYVLKYPKKHELRGSSAPVQESDESKKRKLEETAVASAPE
jgi:hypothetical protein